MNTKVSTIALIAGLSLPQVAIPQQSCALDGNGRLVGTCKNADAGDTALMPAPVTSEPETGPVPNASGFVLSLDGEALDADPQIEDRIRKTDIALEQANVQVQLDTLDPKPRLDVETSGAPRVYLPGDTVTLQSETNYPAFIDRAEMRIIDRRAPGGPRLIAAVPVQPNGKTSVTLPEGRDLVVIHRVYDARGRYDETEPLPLMMADDRAQSDTAEEGSQFTARRGIRVTGGTVTVSATDVAPGAVLRTLGEDVRPDANGKLVIERILPVGDYEVDVEVVGGGQNLGLSRPVDIPGAEWFYVAVADLTYGRYSDGATGETTSRTTGRFQYYVDGTTASGYQITSSLDTGEEELSEIFERLDEKDPRDLVGRIDPSDGYPTYGDDSTIVDNTPTSGKFYLRIERDNSFLLWGDYQARLDGNGFLRNERSLYGAQLHYETPRTTSRGDAVAEVDLYAAQPDQLLGRDVFRGTGGSVYFLRQQDISLGTETVTVELRDSVTGRVVERQVLVEGRDYQINHIQGVVTLTRPLTGSTDRRLISTTLNGDETINLVVQYEFTPTTGDVDGFSYGARAEGWVTDNLRLGVTGMIDETGVADQKSVGIDLRYEIGQNSFVQLDYAETDGPGFTSNLSDDGGLVFDTQTGVNGTGSAVKIETQLDLGDLGFDRSGYIGGYFEQREEGFATLDYQVSAATGDETLYGLSAVIEAEPGRLGYNAYVDVYENDAGTDRTEVGLGLTGTLTDRWSIDAALEHLDETSPTQNGTRLDGALRLTYAVNSDVSVYGFGQLTLNSDGLRDNDRFGVGMNGTFGDWVIGAEVSDGDGGLGGRVLATRTDADNNSVYFGYELDPGRALDAGAGAQDNGGKYVIGGRRHISDQVSVFGENTYDLFGNSRELIGAYGITIKPNKFVSYSATVDFGRLTDSVNGDIERNALSFGVRYDDESLRALARVEVRRDDFDDPTLEDTDAIFFVADGEYHISKEARLLFSADLAKTEARGVSFREGEYADVSLGYAFRPIMNERLNVLARYRYFYDTVGQEVDGVAGSGPVQESHIVSVEGNYDLNPQWTLGAKVGGRFAESAAAAGGTFANNDAWLAVANARFHVVHNWDVLLEARHLKLVDEGSSQTSFLGAAYRHVNNNAKVGVGYNFGDFSSDLTDLTYDDKGMFVNLVLKY